MPVWMNLETGIIRRVGGKDKHPANQWARFSQPDPYGQADILEITLPCYRTTDAGTLGESHTVDSLGSVYQIPRAMTTSEKDAARSNRQLWAAKAIDQYSTVLISKGFKYTIPEDQSRVYSLSPAAQDTLQALYLSADRLTYPQTISSKDSVEIDVASAIDLKNWVEAGLDHIMQILNKGRSLKTSVNAASTAALVESESTLVIHPLKGWIDSRSGNSLYDSDV